MVVAEREKAVSKTKASGKKVKAGGKKAAARKTGARGGVARVVKYDATHAVAADGGETTHFGGYVTIDGERLGAYGDDRSDNFRDEAAEIVCRKLGLDQSAWFEDVFEAVYGIVEGNRGEIKRDGDAVMFRVGRGRWQRAEALA